MDDRKDAAGKEMLFKLRRLRQARKGMEDQKRGDGKGYSMEGMRLVALLNQLQAVQAVQGLRELAPRRGADAARFEFSSSAEERDRQRQWLTLKADWLEALLEDTVAEIEALNRFESAGVGGQLEKRIFERKLIERPSLAEIAMVSEDSRRIEGRVLDYSAGGLRIELRERVPKGSPLRLSLGGGAELSTLVMWSAAIDEACQAGLRFEGDPEDVYEEVKRHFEGGTG